ncbi:hypothetical protein [Epilithonimonas lactis]|uniref:Lipoprotein n=1 Tax=Epilithonimonas lactis TaxID=421072 RepID=A0A085BM90_9FLAO|nr:hypothetical protein [Epilithonimonas lactis]KFC23585.1 hypothetical protein IO89_03120 [Epilithonimonas lactis]SEQ18440.1 hypothetical protein SAMN04488097_1589 [Epilithonimonas lactis]
MKKIIVASVLILLSACSKETPVLNNSDNLDAAPQMVYDTTAIDSFGPGATSEAVMAKINAVAIKKEQDSLAKIAKAEQEKLDKEKAKLEAEKAKEPKTEQPTPTTNP